jgi:NitT/TauT family transport system substrate-binding protein
MNLASRRTSRGSAAGNLLTLLLLVGLIALGVYLWLGRKPAADAPATQTTAQSSGNEAEPDGEAPAPIEPVDGTPTLDAAATYEPKDNVLQIDISEYAGYGGLIVANGGLEPNPDSFFAKEYGFQV